MRAGRYGKYLVAKLVADSSECPVSAKCVSYVFHIELLEPIPRYVAEVNVGIHLVVSSVYVLREPN